MNTLFNWALQNWIEVCGTVAGLIYLWFSIRQNILTWPAGFITSVLYGWVFLDAKFYAGMGLQIYYVLISIYGWWSWEYSDPNNAGTKTLHISRTGIKLWIWIFIVNMLLFLSISYILVNLTDSPIPYWDAFTTSLSIIATWMLARKKFEHWLLWMIIDTVSIGLYFYRGLYPTTVLFLAYTVMAVIGYYEWRKDLKTIECQVRAV